MARPKTRPYLRGLDYRKDFEVLKKEYNELYKDYEALRRQLESLSILLVDKIETRIIPYIDSIIQPNKKEDLKEEEYLSSKQVRELLKISHGTLGKLIKQNKIPYNKIGYHYRFNKAELLNWLNSSN